MAIACLLLTACATSGPATVVDAGCYWTRPIYIGREDVLTDETARQILVHNETWELRCREQ